MQDDVWSAVPHGRAKKLSYQASLGPTISRRTCEKYSDAVGSADKSTHTHAHTRTSTRMLVRNPKVLPPDEAAEA